MVTINPADCKPDEVYEGTVHGVERTVLIRRDASDSYPWESLGEVLDHEDVSDLVRLVPARPVTRNDLPSVIKSHRYGDLHFSRIQELEGYKDDVVEHLNANGGVPASREDASLADRLERQAATICELQGSFLSVERAADRWRRAHAIVEQERDTARERLREVDSALAKCMSDYQDAEDERDAAKYAETEMERERDEWKARSGEWYGKWQKIALASTVTREDVTQAVRRYIPNPHFSEPIADEVCALFGIETEPADPVEGKARELFDAAGRGNSEIEFDEIAPDHRGEYLRIAAHVLEQEAKR